jgi:ribosomal protein S12 methylthiotransferase accessory factor YcaO
MSSQSVADSFREKTTIDLSTYVPFIRTDINRSERIALWHGKEMLNKLQFFISGKTCTFAAFSEKFISYASPKEELEALSTRLKEMGEGYEVYAYELKSETLETLGYHVVKVIIPKLVSLHLSEHEAGLNASRLATVPVKLGYTSSKLNPLPHPFP